MPSDLRRRIREFIATEILFEDPAHPSIDDEGPLLSNLDSFGLMSLVTFLEEDLDITVEDGDITPENFRSIAAVERFATEKASQV